MSYILRHHPEKFNLKINPDGTINIKKFIASLKSKFSSITREEVLDVVKNDSKNRFSIIDKKYIRANYGHSIEGINPDYKEVKPPKCLFHGTAKRNLPSIKKKGLLPKNRNFVHLSKSRKEAEKVGKRHDISPVILEINAIKAYNDGIKFYEAGTVFLANMVSFEYINFNLK